MAMELENIVANTVYIKAREGTCAKRPGHGASHACLNAALGACMAGRAHALLKVDC